MRESVNSAERRFLMANGELDEVRNALETVSRLSIQMADNDHVKPFCLLDEGLSIAFPWQPVYCIPFPSNMFPEGLDFVINI